MKATVANIGGLVAMGEHAERLGLNRQINHELLKTRGDDDRIAVLVMQFGHEHKAGVKCDWHWRTKWAVPINGQSDPEMLWIDVMEEDLHTHTARIDVPDYDGDAPWPLDGSTLLSLKTQSEIAKAADCDCVQEQEQCRDFPACQEEEEGDPNYNSRGPNYDVLDRRDGIA
jgi:hypothetical protein